MLSFHPTTTNKQPFSHSNCKMKKGSIRFSDVMRQTGGDSDEISHKPSKKLKPSSFVGEMDQSTSSKRVRLPRKFLDDCHTVNHVSVPRKSRSAMKKRHNEYVSASSPNVTNVNLKSEMPFEDRNKKLKLAADNSRMLELFVEQLAVDEEEAIAGLLLLAGICPENNKTREINLNNEISEAEASKPEDLVQKSLQIEDLNESRNKVKVEKDFKVVSGGNKSRKRCASHVYICQIIKDLQTEESKKVNSLKEPKIDITPETILNHNTVTNPNEASTASKSIFQDLQSGCGLQSYFGNPFCDPSQWSRPMFPKQQMWMNPFMPTCSNSYVQPSMLDVLASKQQLQYKMRFGQQSSGYEENGGSFRVDSSPTLKLTLQ